MNFNLTHLVQSTKRSLLRLADQLNDVEVVVFQEFSLKSEQFRNMLDFDSHILIRQNPNPLIYVITITDSFEKQYLIERFANFSKENKLKAKSKDRLNHSRYNDKNVPESLVLYVGSSLNGFKNRLKDHLGVKKGLRTYGLHLSKWDNGLDYSIQVKSYEVRSKLPVERHLVELLEQQIWDELQPAFGKRSGLL